ncbi:MAG TPA: GNAT family N-acetyltransferase [Actinophytocola sp.]|jgi:ribosomal protein S18 acetylase RimI-like enzyme|nr:GNAT family N-acetyltransferase [Actinophytocola sp.]
MPHGLENARTGEADASRAERALFARMTLACRAATAESTAGRFLTWEHAGLFAVLATGPDLAFLSTVSGVTPENVAAAIDMAGAPVWNGVAPTVIVSMDDDREVAAAFLAAEMDRGPDRALAIRRLAPPDDGPVPEVSRATDAGAFLDVLLAGYEVTGPLARFIAAEHGHPAVRRFLLSEGGIPIAAAAMTMHGDVAVLGGASTVPEHRGRGAQSRLIAHRVRLAVEHGCTVAVATVRPGSVSAKNLRRAGFRIHRRATWVPHQRCAPFIDADGIGLHVSRLWR